MPKPYGYSDTVFFNCPFDDDYMPIFRAIIFTIYRCGFYPKSALSEDNGLDNRIDKISRMIRACRYGVHDISRTELNGNGLPRFNMPFELGIFYGAKQFGDRRQKEKNALILERVKYLYQQYLSDLNGVDTKAHNNDPLEAIQKVRDWLRATSLRSTIPSYAVVRNAYLEFEAIFPEIASNLQIEANEIHFNDFCVIVEDFIAASQ